MTKTLIDIPDELLGEAMEVLGTRTKADTVRQALAEAVRRRRTPAIERARSLDVVFSDAALTFHTGLSPQRADELVDALRLDRDAG